MERKILVLISCAGFSLLYLVVGCEQEKISPPVQAEIKIPDINIPQGPVKGPKITFEKTTYDLGVVSTNLSSTCEFKFKSSGTETLEIKNVRTTCGCTTAKLDKTQYQPGESSSITVTYHTGPLNENASKTIYVSTNDVNTPNIPLTIKATVVKKVEVKPESLSLSLKKQNAGCPEITLQSTDNVPFAIKEIKSTADCITIDFDPSKQQTQHILNPAVDLKKLEQVLTGNIQFNLSHPQCNTVTVNFTAPAEFSTSPPTILILNAQPQEPTIRDQIWVFSNYDEDFEIESIYSQKGYIKNLSTEKPKIGQYIMKLEITPPKKENNVNNFIDTLIIKTKNGKEVKITCRGYYRRATARPAEKSK